MVWTIELCERPVNSGKRLNRIVLGQPMGHSFLALVDDEGTVRTEIHGGTFDESRGRIFLARPARITKYFMALSTVAGLDVVFDKTLRYTGLGKYQPRLLAAVTIGRWQYPIAKTIHVVDAGGERDMAAKWLLMLDAAKAVNAQRPTYYTFPKKTRGQNCHSVIATLLEAAGHAFPDDALSMNTYGRHRKLPAPAFNAAAMRDASLEEVMFTLHSFPPELVVERKYSRPPSKRSVAAGLGRLLRR